MYKLYDDLNLKWKQENKHKETTRMGIGVKS